MIINVWDVSWGRKVVKNFGCKSLREEVILDDIDIDERVILLSILK